MTRGALLRTVSTLSQVPPSRNRVQTTNGVESQPPKSGDFRGALFQLSSTGMAQTSAVSRTAQHRQNQGRRL